MYQVHHTRIDIRLVYRYYLLRLSTFPVNDTLDISLHLPEVSLNYIPDRLVCPFFRNPVEQFRTFLFSKGVTHSLCFFGHIVLVVEDDTLHQLAHEVIEQCLVRIVIYRLSCLLLSEVSKFRKPSPSLPLALKFIKIMYNLPAEELLLDLHVVIVGDLTEEDPLRQGLYGTERQQLLMLE